MQEIERTRSVVRVKLMRRYPRPGNRRNDGESGGVICRNGQTLLSNACSRCRTLAEDTPVAGGRRRAGP